MSETAAFHRAILDHPGEDLPRLIYADAIEESGRPERADFIRAQVELAAAEPDDPRIPDLKARQDRLFARHWRDWVAELPPLDGIIWSRFHRGFVGHVDVDFVVDAAGARRLEEYSATILASAPIQSLWFRGLSRAGAARIADDPLLRGILELDFGGLQVNPDAALDLATSDGPACLQSILCGGPAWTASHASRIAESRLVESLVRLKFAGTSLGDEGAIALAKAGPWGRLRELILSDCRVGERGALAILGSGLDRQLRLLDLQSNDIPRPARSGLARLFGEALRPVGWGAAGGRG
jgi:uncharacterized protein (TIGR02996 family)